MKKTIRDIDVRGKRVVLRCDFNVPIQDGKITDDTRIRAALPTIKYLQDRGAGIIILSHLGRPKGKADSAYTLEPAAERLAQLLKKDVAFGQSDVVVDPSVVAVAQMVSQGEILVLENVRFRKEETENDPEFAKELASLGDIFVHDAFGTAHRAHASTEGIAAYIPAVSGLLMEKELKFLGDAVEEPKRPFLAILGGAKVADKIKVIENLINKVDSLIIGGGMAYTFLKAKGLEVGESILDSESIDLAMELMKKAEAKGVKLLLPVDVRVAKEFSNDALVGVVPVDKIPAELQGMDIGDETCKLFAEEIKKANTVLWNGPMGVFEMENFQVGTRAVAQAMADSEANTIIGGGDSAAAVNQFGLGDRMTHISTGGGASLEFMEGNGLPGVECLADFERRPFIVGNWKMFKSKIGAVAFGMNMTELLKEETSEADVDLAIAAPYLQLDVLKYSLRETSVKVGAQNMHYETEGAFTGEISGEMLLDVGVDCCIIGHSERRQYFGETDEAVNKKLKKAIELGIKPIVCVGESLEEREKGAAFDVVKNQLLIGFEGISSEEARTVVVAYEPIWAIGTGKTASAEDAEEMCKFIRSCLGEMKGQLEAEGIVIQYGGSVKPENAFELMSMPNIDGALVGGASLNAEDFYEIYKLCKKAKTK